MYDKANTEPVKTGNIILDSGVFLSFNWKIVVAQSASNLKLIGILVLDDDSKKTSNSNSTAWLTFCF